MTGTAWLALIVGAVLVGFAKTAFGGAASLGVVLFAAVLPARDSTGALLPLLLVGDLIAIGVYRRHGSWTTLLRLVPGIVPGLLLGAWFLAIADDHTMRLTLGLVLMVLSVLQLGQLTRAPARVGVVTPHPGWSTAVGALAGFATMTANAGGPVVTLYLILAGLPVLGMLGTTAWFFLAVNLAKLPLSAGLGLVSASSLTRDVLLVPALALGALVGWLVVTRIRQRVFEVTAVTVGLVAATLLVVAG